MLAGYWPDQVRSQEFVMEDCFGVLGVWPPAAGGQWGSEGEAPSRRGQGSLGAEPPAIGDFYDFLTKITHF